MSKWLLAGLMVWLGAAAGCSGGASEAKPGTATQSLPANTQTAKRCDKPTTTAEELAHCAVGALQRGDADSFAQLFPTREEVAVHCPPGMEEFERQVEGRKGEIAPAFKTCAARIDWKTATVVGTRGGGERHKEKECGGDLWEMEALEVVVKQGKEEWLVQLEDVLRIGGRYTVLVPPTCMVKGNNPLVDEFEKAVTQICACPDMRCVEKVQKGMMDRYEELKQYHPKNEDEQAHLAKRMQPLTEKMVGCIDKLSNGTP